jgi:hypothetical protein
MKFVRCERASDDRVRIALNEQYVGVLRHQYWFKRYQYATSLVGVTAGADIQIVFRGREIEFGEKDPVESLGVMLLRMDDEVIEFSLLAFANNRRHFDDFRASSNQNGDFHRSSMRGFSTKCHYAWPAVAQGFAYRTAAPVQGVCGLSNCRYKMPESLRILEKAGQA